MIPTYCRLALLSKCLDALSRQDFNKHNFEVIVVSDGPDPKGSDLIRQFGDWLQIRYIQLARKAGPAAARNAGWRAAKGALIAFTDDDCQPDVQWLTKIYENYNGESLAAYSGKVIVPLPPSPTDFDLNTAHLEKADFITANCACTRATLELTGGFDERFELAWREDSDLEFKLIEHQIPIKKVAAVVVHPVRKAQWGVSIKEQKKGMYNALLYKKFPELYRSKIQKTPLWNYYLIVLSFIMCISAWQQPLIALLSFSIWLMLTGTFVYKRLKNTSRSISHVSEMVLTSLVIPFISVYWQIYGAIRYRVLFI